MASIVANPDGSIEFIYSDDLMPLADLGQYSSFRASHVEPEGREWTADLHPVGGPVLGPFPTRKAALDAEVAWLQENLISR